MPPHPRRAFVRGGDHLLIILDAALTSVPSSENSAWFWLIGKNWPSQSAYPFGPWTKLVVRLSD
jgi:hypothetical protein